MTRFWGIHNDTIPARQLVDERFISIGWDEIGDLRTVGDDQAAVREVLREAYPEAKEGALPVWAGVLRRFAFTIEVGDVVIAPDRENKLVHIGRISGPYEYVRSTAAHMHRRPVEWLAIGVPRTSFGQPALSEIGSALTLFEVRRHATDFRDALRDAGYSADVAVPVASDPATAEDSLRDLSDEFLRAIRTGDSVFTPGRAIWTRQATDELQHAFVDRPDDGGRSFDEKLDDQLAGTSDAALQLFAEIWCLNLAPLSDYTPHRKRLLLTGVLEKMTRPASLPPIVDAGLEGRMFNGGVAFKTRRSFQLTLLIRVASALVGLSDEERATVLSDPKAFERLLSSMPKPGEPAQRCALRWLLFPDYYVGIVSSRHRMAIRHAFADLLDGTAADLDEELHQIVTQLSEGGDRAVNFYEPPLIGRWDKDGTLWGPPSSADDAHAHADFRMPRSDLVSTAVAAVRTGEWTAHTDIAEVAGVQASAVADYLEKVRDDGWHRVATSDRIRAEQREALEAEGVTFDVDGAARPDQRVTVADLRERLEGDGSLPKASRRAWLVRGNVNGRDLEPDWMARDVVTLAAASLREVEPGLTRDELKSIVDEDYSHASYAARMEKLDEFHAFLTRMQPGHVLVTVDRDRLHLGEISGEASYQGSGGTDTRLVRGVTWKTQVDLNRLPSDLSARLKVQREVLDLTQHLDVLEKLLEHRDEPLEKPLVLPDATDELAESLHVHRDWLQECIELLRDRRQLIFYGPPGTGKTYIAQALAKHIGGANRRLIQFHPAYSYEDFFEGFRPTASGGFELKAGPMRRIVEQAKNSSEPHVLIIDEINRGNLAKIFGELYFLLEYRDEPVDLLYGDAEGGFSLPKNLFIIGTMNTADRSIALVDAAMRRRFSFLPLHPSETPASGVLRAWLRAQNHPSRCADLLDELNRQIVDQDFKIGPSYFMRPEVHREGGLERMWRTSILPLLEEHHFGELSSSEVATRFGYSAIAERVDAAVGPSGQHAPAPVVNDDVVGDHDASSDAD